MSSPGIAVVGRVTAERRSRRPRRSINGSMPGIVWGLIATVVVGVSVFAAKLPFAGAGAPGAPRTLAISAARAEATSGALPAAAAPVVSRSLGRDDPAYAARSAEGGFIARTPTERMSTRFSAGGIRVSSGAHHLSLRLAGEGRGDSLMSVAPAAPTALANRVSYAHHGVREWYANGPLGLEQDFRVAAAPAGHGAGPLELSLAVGGGLRPTLSGGAVTFRTQHGVAAFTYRDLVAVDATGRQLGAHLALRHGRLLISVDDRGARYPIRVDPFVQAATLYASDSAQTTNGADQFGQAIASEGNTIVAGAPQATVDGQSVAGAVYVFTKSADGWADATQAKLVDSSSGQGEQFGDVVAISGNTIVAGTDTRKTLVFVRPDGGWADGTPVTAQLTDPDPQGGDSALAIQDSTIVVGDRYGNRPGQIEVYGEPAGGWADAGPPAILTTTDDAGGLGFAVGISGDTIVAGSGSNSAYVWTEPAGGWENATQTAQLSASNPSQYPNFGQAVAIDGDTIAVGAYQQSTATQTDGGAIYVYTEPSGGWTDATQTAELSNPSGSSYDYLGVAVAVSGGTILGDAGNFDQDAGALEVFTEPPGGWVDSTDPEVVTDDVPNAYLLGERGVGFGSDGALVASTNGSNQAVVVFTQPAPAAITSSPSANVNVHSPLDFQVTASGAPAPSLSETGALPTGMSFTDNGNGTADLAGTPAVGSAGSYRLTITASNASGPDATQAFTLTVSATPSAPAFTSASAETESYGQAFSDTVATSGYPIPKLTKSGSVPGVSFHDNGDGTATISGTPSGSASGRYTLTIVAASSAGKATQSFTLTVTRPPSLAPIKNATVIAGTLVNVSVAAPVGYPMPSVSESGALPAGVQFAANPDGSSTFSGTPAAGSGGSYPITVTASNGTGSASRSFTLTVQEAPAFTSATAANATTGQSFTFQASATGTPTPKITESGKLPAGVTWHAAAATVSGTPKKGTAGSYPITFTATNKAGTTNQQFTLTVH